jgi:glycosyltransferase involved in cell wall biosynthesis
LVIKSFPNPHNDVAARIAALAGADMPAIELIDRDMALDELTALYGQADAMVLPARGEGFNLPAAEAMAAGLPLIVTGHGGHMDFCGPDNARLVDFRLAASGSHVAPPLSLWAEPDVDDLAAALREAYCGAPEVAARTARAREGIGPAMSRANFVRRVEEAALRAVTRPPARPLRLCVVSSWNVRCGIAEYTRFLLDAIGRADASIEISVLSDTRPVIGPETGIAARPAWALGSARAAASLQQAVSVDDPDIVLIQHQPGLLDWVSLGCLLSSLAAPHLVLAVTLHNTAHLLEVEDEDRESALEGLRVASRLLVHSLADVERLRGLGLVDNVVLIPHGAPDVVRTNHVRSLTGNDTVTIGSYGFLLRDKGIPHLIEAAGLLKARWPKIRLCLLHADYGGEESKATLAACREAVVASGLDGAVELVTDFLPFETSRARLAACDVIALPYQRSKEGASGALRVALSTGTCVAVSPLRVFDDAEDAVYRLPGLAASDIAEGLACLLGDRDLRARTSHAARQWTMERHWDAVASRTLGMLRGLSVSEREA